MKNCNFGTKHENPWVEESLALNGRVSTGLYVHDAT